MPSLRPLAIGLLAAPIVWIVHHFISYALIETACRTGLLGGEVGDLTAASLVVLGLTVAGIAVIIWSGFASYRRYQRRHAQIQDTEYPNPAETAARFMALAAVMLSVLFGLLVLMAGLPALFLSPCVVA
jgi:hypothetical protein